MKVLLIILLMLFLHQATTAQEVKAYIKDLTTKQFTLEEFKNEAFIKLTDSTKKVHQYTVIVCPDSADIMAITIAGSSLKNKEFQNFLDKYKNCNRIRLFFENISYWVGLGYGNGYKIAKMAVPVIEIRRP